MIIIDALIVAYGMMLLGGILVVSIFLTGLVMIVVGLVKFYDKPKWRSYKDLKRSILVDKEISKFYDQERNTSHNKKVAKHTRAE